jgi:hypothetical protein
VVPFLQNPPQCPFAISMKGLIPGKTLLRFMGISELVPRGMPQADFLLRSGAA